MTVVKKDEHNLISGFLKEVSSLLTAGWLLIGLLVGLAC